ncbi:hypothetical protein [Aestuariibaculum marinum]|uniref:Uncharacterized protein n=1 Tax=Aestuariibaculum marinum TaxID=2683592 RepID=A0A8J6PU27_9FLAO|nr:hypothetical protein [Aestuariibaculum marinum]MBD0824239.1 hypothetical protein [Aestuariibaculum marinum]
MMTKNLLYTVLIGIFGLLMFQACQDDPTFPDPGFEISDQRVEVRRDTADYYNVHMRMTVPNKVKEILVLDGLDYNLVETITEYNGETNFDFDYVVDLTEITEETVLNYIIKVTDEDGRSFNRGIRIVVQPFSFPTIDLIGGNNVAIVAPAYNVKGDINTGLNTIALVQVIYNDQVSYEYQPNQGEELNEMSLKALVLMGELEVGQEYPIEIFIRDSEGQESTTVVTITKTDVLKKPTRINYINRTGTIWYIIPTYDADGNIIQIDYHTPSKSTWNIWEFTYNDMGMVETIVQNPLYSDGSPRDYKNFTFINYVPASSQISSVQSRSNDYDEDGNLVSEGDLDDERFDIVYNASNEIESFGYSRYSVDEVVYQDPFGLGESVFSMWWQSESYMRASDRRQKVKAFDPVLMPTFMEGFPPICNHISLDDVANDILWYKYVPTTVVSTDDEENPYQYLNLPKFTYETDEDGNVIELVKTFTGYREGDVETYLFFYDEE